MATLDSTVTQEWTDIKTSLSLTEGVTYVVDSLLGSTVYIRQDSTVPTSTIGHPLDPKESRRIAVTSDKVWVRCDGANSKIVLTPEA